MPMLNGVPPPLDSAQPAQRSDPMTVVPLNFQYGPLTRENFTKAYFQQWVPRHPIDQSILSPDGRNIDLWALHAEVMGMNGYRCFVQQIGPNQPGQILCNLVIPPDQWPIIAGRLGFVNFPDDAREPAKSSPVVAVHLEHVYRQCLQEFDSQYLRQVIHHRKMMILQQQRVNGTDNRGPSVAPPAPSDTEDVNAIGQIIDNFANLSVEQASQTQSEQLAQPMDMLSTSMMDLNVQPQNGGGVIPIVAPRRPTKAEMMMAAIELVRRLKEENKRKSGTASAPACTNLVAQTLVSPMLVHFKFLMRRGWSTTFSLSDCIAWSRPSTRSCSTSRSV